MAQRAIYVVNVNGQDISSILSPILISLSVSDKEGTSSDTCEIEIDDTDGRIQMPTIGAAISILLGWQGGNVTEVFRGKVDEVKSKGDRGGGRKLSISGKGVDTNGKAKQRQSRHMDNMNLRSALQKAGQAAGITDIRVDPQLASIMRPYWHMDAESFLHFGQRIANEVGGTFKISDNRAVMARRGSGQSASGQTMPTVTAAWGDNLISWDIAPQMGRPKYKEVRGRYYDRTAATWRDVRVQVPDADATATVTRRHTSANRDEAQRAAQNDATDANKNKGGGSVSINGNVAARAGGTCVIVGARPGIDGSYKIESVEHNIDRSGGFTTKLTLKQPDAKKDSRRANRRSSSSSGSGPTTPSTPSLGGQGGVGVQ